MKKSFEKFGTCLFILVFSSHFSVFAQSEPESFTAKHAVYLDLGGNAGQYAFTYGRLIHQDGSFKVMGSIGFSLWADRVNGSTVLNPAVPLEVSGLLGRGKHHFELGIGGTPHLATSLDFNAETSELEDKLVFSSLIPLRIGYRYQKPEGGFFFRIGYTPFYDVPVRAGKIWSFNPYWAGISFGKSF